MIDQGNYTKYKKCRKKIENVSYKKWRTEKRYYKDVEYVENRD